MLVNHKKYFLLILTLLASSLKGQYASVKERVTNLPNFDEKTIHYGYFIGFNSYDFKFEYTDEYYRINNYPDIQVNSTTGFNVGLIGDLRINRFFNIRIEPGLLYSQRDLIYPNLPLFNSENDLIREVKSTYIHVPLLLKISAKRINNFKPYITFGTSVDYNLSSNAKNTDDNSSNVFRTRSKSLNYELGFGFDFYLYYFKFSPSIRGVFSIDNELISDYDIKSPWTGNIKNMYSRGVVINFTFE